MLLFARNYKYKEKKNTSEVDGLTNSRSLFPFKIITKSSQKCWVIRHATETWHRYLNIVHVKVGTERE